MAMNKLDVSRLGAEARRRQGFASNNRVYAYIRSNPGCSVYRIAQDLNIDAGTAGSVVDRLEKAGTIKRKKSRGKNGAFKWKIYASDQSMQSIEVISSATKLEQALKDVLTRHDLLGEEECKSLEKLDEVMKNFWYNARKPDKE